MMENGSEDSETVLVYNNGPMEQGMKVIGRIIELTEKENSHTLMATFMMETGLTTKQMATESTIT